MEQIQLMIYKLKIEKDVKKLADLYDEGYACAESVMTKLGF